MRAGGGVGIPPAGEVHVWTAVPDLYDEAALARCAGLLAPDEAARAARFAFQKDRAAYVVAHALLRRALSCHARIRPADWRFRSGAHGRPELSGPEPLPPLRFSLSHTTGLVSCAVTGGAEVGIDVQQLREPAPLKVAEARFAPEEVALLRAADGAARTRLFYRFWTLKEAYLKARGVGLSRSLRGVRFDLEDERVRLAAAPSDDDAAAWSFATLDVGPGHHLSLAARVPELRVVVRAGERP